MPWSDHYDSPASPRKPSPVASLIAGLQKPNAPFPGLMVLLVRQEARALLVAHLVFAASSPGRLPASERRWRTYAVVAYVCSLSTFSETSCDASEKIDGFEIVHVISVIVNRYSFCFKREKWW